MPERHFKFLRKFAKIFATQDALPGDSNTGGKSTSVVVDTGGKFTTGGNDTGGHICPLPRFALMTVSPAALITVTPAVTLLPVSTTPVVFGHCTANPV
jgi:hypothetical protein